jgi:hypothetical protein
LTSAALATVWPATKLTSEVSGTAPFAGKTVRWPGPTGPTTVKFRAAATALAGTPQTPVIVTLVISPPGKGDPLRESNTRQGVRGIYSGPLMGWAATETARPSVRTSIRDARAGTIGASLLGSRHCRSRDDSREPPTSHVRLLARLQGELARSARLPGPEEGVSHGSQLHRSPHVALGHIWRKEGAHEEAGEQGALTSLICHSIT